jgi:hypothetical protein
MNHQTATHARNTDAAPLLSLGPGGDYRVEYLRNGRNLTAVHQSHGTTQTPGTPLKMPQLGLLDRILGILRVRIPVETVPPQDVHHSARTRPVTRKSPKTDTNDMLQSVRNHLQRGAVGGFGLTPKGRRTMTARNINDIAALLENPLETYTRVTDPETSGNLSSDPRRTNEPGLFPDTPGTGSAARREPGHRARARRTTHQERRANSRDEQGTLFISC